MPEQPLAIPPDHDGRIAHARQAQQFFGNRFPTPDEFAKFLRANLAFQFDEGSFYECSMSYCGGGPVSEGYSTDIDINAPAWFRSFEKATLSAGRWTGAKLLKLLYHL